MTLLILGIYFADIVTGLKFVLGLVLVILGILAFVFILLLFLELDYGEVDSSKKIFSACYKKYFSVLILSVFTFCFMPSKNAIYIATGLVSGQKVLEQVQTNPLYEKSIKLLEKKIDEALSEVQEPKRKKDKN